MNMLIIKKDMCIVFYHSIYQKAICAIVMF